MFLIAVEVEYTLNEVLEKHGGVPLQQQVSKAKLPKAAKERRKETHLVLTNTLWIHEELSQTKKAQHLKHIQQTASSAPREPGMLLVLSVLLNSSFQS